MTSIDFTSCPRIPFRAYNGANGKKVAVLFQGEPWILKFPPNVSLRPNDQSYSNSCFSEHLGSSVYRLLGVPCQETVLGTFINGKTKVVCACKDFTRPGVHLYDFCSIKNTVIDSDTGGRGTELSDILETIGLQSFVDPKIVYERFWKMFVTDALIGNFDRHNGNWGFLVEEETKTSSLAPVFDCGSCLLPQADNNIMQRCLEDEDEMNARIYTFPASMIKQENKKINYFDFLHSPDMPQGLCTALSQLLPRIRTLDFSALVDATPYLSSLQRQFYKQYFMRRRQILFQ